MMLPKDFKEFIELLNIHEVRYLIFGGYAVSYHGHPRMTGDIDILIDMAEDNALKLQAAPAEFGFASLGLKATDFLEPKTIVQLGYPPLRIDILTTVSGVSFEEAWARKVSPEVNGLTVHFVGKDDLLKNKAAAGRPKDLDDLNALS